MAGTGDDKFANVYALVNPNSGERASAQFLYEDLQRLLPGRVVNLMKDGPVKGSANSIEMIKGMPRGSVLIVAGGDGTVSWGMDLCDKSGLSESDKPHISVIPMGTGNDLSRCLNFGGGFAKETCCCGCSACCRIDDLTETVATCCGQLGAKQGNMDRWHIDIKSTAGLDLLNGGKTMNNYFSIGFDAHIADQFDTFRTNNPNFCKSRLRNKMVYGMLGTGALCGEPQLNKTVKLMVDGKETPLPDGIKSLIVSNVDSYSGGVKLWKDGSNKFKPVKVDDGLVEVQGIYGSFHMGMMQGGMRSAAKICQGANIQIVVGGQHHMQYDGEPLRQIQEACNISISHSGYPKILNNQGNKKVK